MCNPFRRPRPSRSSCGWLRWAASGWRRWTTPKSASTACWSITTARGYSENWINQRLKSIEVRKELTDEWERRGVKKGAEYATLTDIITQGWSGMTTRQYKQYKGLKTESLRDNMTNLELVLNMLAEASTTEISKEKQPRTAAQNRKVAAEGGSVAAAARKTLEARTGKKVVSRFNAKQVLAAKQAEQIEAAEEEK